MKRSLVIDLCDEPPAPQKKPPSNLHSRHMFRKEFVAKWLPGKLLEIRVTPTERRSLLEVFKYLSVSNLEVAARTCRVWLQVERDEEIWTERFVTDFRVRKTESGRCYRTEYLSRLLGTCWNCGFLIPDLAVECPEINRLLCLKCSQQPDCRVVPVSALIKQFCFSPELLTYLHVPTFEINRQNCTYAAMLTRKLRPYYERRRNELVHLLPRSISKSTKKQLQEFDFKKVFAWSGSIGPVHMMALFIFCGKNEATESLEDSLKHFIDHCKLLS